jgi:hypothetical protein
MQYKQKGRKDGRREGGEKVGKKLLQRGLGAEAEMMAMLEWWSEKGCV